MITTIITVLAGACIGAGLKHLIGKQRVLNAQTAAEHWRKEWCRAASQNMELRREKAGRMAPANAARKAKQTAARHLRMEAAEQRSAMREAAE